MWHYIAFEAQEVMVWIALPLARNKLSIVRDPSRLWHINKCSGLWSSPHSLSISCDVAPCPKFFHHDTRSQSVQSFPCSLWEMVPKHTFFHKQLLTIVWRMECSAFSDQEWTLILKFLKVVFVLGQITAAVATVEEAQGVQVTTTIKLKI